MSRATTADYPVDVSASGARFRLVPDDPTPGGRLRAHVETGFALGLAFGMVVVALAL